MTKGNGKKRLRDAYIDKDPIERAREKYESDIKMSAPSAKKKKAIIKANKKRASLHDAYKKWHWTPRVTG